MCLFSLPINGLKCAFLESQNIVLVWYKEKEVYGKVMAFTNVTGYMG